MARNILVVEDDNNISNLIKMYLDKEGFDVRIAADGGKAVEEFKEKEPDLVLLDVMLPVLDGWGVCAKIRETSKCPIIMLTAKGEVNDRIHGLEMGADDYVVKPFEMKELLARINAVLRRSEIPEDTHKRLTFDKLISADTQRLYEQAEEQAKLNRAAFARDLDLHQSALARLSEQIRNCLLVHQQPERIPARQGWLDGTKVWREPVLHDDRVFLRSDEESRPGFAVDLMLDASASRLHCQEAIAIQGYILAKSLASCGIPVRVTSFCSLRGYTVLRILKDFGDKNGERNVFNYFAAGWNRDGLALRGAGELIKSAPAEKHLLILLTDASPDDSHKILPSGKVPLSRDYDGQIGVDDTAEEVRALRAQGIRVAAVFMGENASVPAANAIYGRDLARIRRIDQLAATAGRLIQDEIRELSS